MLKNGKKNENTLLDAKEAAHIRAMISTGKRKIKTLAIKLKSTQDAVEKRRLCMEIDSIEREFQKEYRKAVASVLEHAC